MNIAFDKPMDDTDDHFQREETFMRDINFPSIAAHYAKRGEMEARLRELHERHNGGDTGVAFDMTACLNDWWH